jgi:hypothetical protein
MNPSKYLPPLAQEIQQALIRFLRHPLSEMRSLPDWDWQRLLLLHFFITASTGVLSGLTGPRVFGGILSGLFFKPVVTLIILAISSLFFYYCFQIFAGKTVAPRQLFTVILFANIPQFIFQVLEVLVPPIVLVGMAFTAFLLLVGFVENFKLDRRLASRIIAFIYVLFFTLWMWNKISTSQIEKSWKADSDDAPAVELGK